MVSKEIETWSEQDDFSVGAEFDFATMGDFLQAVQQNFATTSYNVITPENIVTDSNPHKLASGVIFSESILPTKKEIYSDFQRAINIISQNRVLYDKLYQVASVDARRLMDLCCKPNETKIPGFTSPVNEFVSNTISTGSISGINIVNSESEHEHCKKCQGELENGQCPRCSQAKAA